MENKENVFGKRALALGAIIFGWLICGYLVFRSTQLQGERAPAADVCKIVFGNTCDRTLSTSVSWHLGYPLAGLGLAYFGLLGLLFSLRKPLADWATILVAAFGVGVSVVLSGLIFKAGVPCPMCLLVHFTNLLVLIVLFLGMYPLVFSGEQKRASLTRWTVLLLVCLVAGGASEFAVLKTSIGQRVKVDNNEVLRNFQAETVHNIAVGGASPMIGSPDAPVQMVVFSSFQCPACQGFAPSLEKIRQTFGDKVGITFKNFPLSSTCNPRLVEDMQPRSCYAALAALAAHRQNRFWDYHDGLFESDLEYDDPSLNAIAEKIGLNMTQWATDLASDSVKLRLLEDISQANEMQINATPTVFINGRRVGAFQESALVFLIENELKGPSN